MNRASKLEHLTVNQAFTIFGYAQGMFEGFIGRLLARAMAMLFLLVGLASPALANITFQLTTGDDATNRQSLVVDSNKCPAQGPTSAYVGGILTNTSGSDVTDIVATMSGLNANVYFAGNQPASQSIGTLGAGESIAVYWFVGNSCNFGSTATPSISTTSSAGTSSETITLTIRDAISANAGGRVISSTLGPGAIVGQTIFFDANYDFGGTDAGDEYFLQPAGGQDFDAECFRLVETEILSSNVNAAPAGVRDQLYFIQPNKQPGNGYFITVRYYFEYLCANASTNARPYAVQTSGNTNVKYTGNFDGTGSISISFPPATNPFTITKTVSEEVGEIGVDSTFTYTVTISNPSTLDSILGEIVDVLPSGMEFVGIAAGSDVVATNSSSLPAAGDTGTLSFVGRRGQSYFIPAGGSVSLIYTATAPATTGDFVNSAQGLFGQASTTTAQATFTMYNPSDAPGNLTCPLGSSTFDWDAVSWPAGSTANTYVFSNLGDIGFTLAEGGSFATNASYGGVMPGLSATITGGNVEGEQALVFNVDRSATSQAGSITIDLPVPMPGAQFTIFDIDANTGHEDAVTVYGLRNGVRVDPSVITTGRLNAESGGVVTGTGPSSDIQSLGNASFTFDAEIDTIVIEYANGAGASADPSEQAIALADLTLCAPIPNLSVTKTSFMVSDPANTDQASAKALPGAIVEYIITVTNSGFGPADPESLIVTDYHSSQIKLCRVNRVGGPVAFNDANDDTGLIYDPTTDLAFSELGDAGFGASLNDDGTGCDANIDGFQFTPSGSMAGNSSFELRVRYQVIPQSGPTAP